MATLKRNRKMRREMEGRSAQSLSGRGAGSAEPSCPSVSHMGTWLDGICPLGRWGFIVPAKTINPSSSFERAKILASPSVANVLVSRGLRLLGSTPRGRLSNVTYQVGGISSRLRTRQLGRHFRQGAWRSFDLGQS